MIGEASKYQQAAADFRLFETAPGLRFVFLPNDEYTIIAISKDMCRLIGADRASVIGLSLEDFCQSDFFHRKRDFYETVRSGLATVIKNKSSNVSDHLECQLAADTGRFNDFHWKAVSTPVLSDQEEIQYIIFSAEDWEANAETRLRKTFTIDTVGVIYFDLDGVIHDANPAFETMSGFSHEDFISGKVRWDRITPPEFMDVTLNSRDEFLSKWQNTPYEKQYFRPDGSRWWGLFAGKRLSENECVEFVLDITLLKNVEHELEKRVKERTRELEIVNVELLRSNNSLEQFAYAASHDLKEPIRKIQLFADRLKKSVEGKLTEQENTFIDSIMTSTIRMSSLVEELLDYSHLNFKNTSFHDVPLNEVVDLVIGDLDLEIEERQAVISVNRLPVVKGNRRQLQQVFQNLIANALKYQHPGNKPYITITCDTVDSKDIHERNVPPDSKYYLITIKDNGIGFEQKYAEQIFNVFTRLHSDDRF